MLLRTTRRPLLSPLVPERDFDPSMLPDNLSEASSPTLAPSSPPQSVSSTPDHLRNNRIPLPPHPLIVQPPPPTSQGPSRWVPPVQSTLTDLCQSADSASQTPCRTQGLACGDSVHLAATHLWQVFDIFPLCNYDLIMC